MELKGESVSSYMYRMQGRVSLHKSITMLQKMLKSIEQAHNVGVLHRDVKPGNFVMGRQGEPDAEELYLVDFGLAKEHLNEQGEAYPPRSSTEFRGTVPYASLASHFKKELGRKDDLWSFFFMMLEFLDQPLPWASLEDKDQVKNSKFKCFAAPTVQLYPRLHEMGVTEVHEIFMYLRGLDYYDRPDYDFIEEKILHTQTKLVAAQSQRIASQLV